MVSSPHFINSLVFDSGVGEPWKLTLVYGPPNPTRRGSFWEDLGDIGNQFAGPWCLIGEFNAVLSSTNKLGGNAVASSSRGGFRRLINENGLIDLGFEGHAFTWNNRRGGLANIQERLDRGFANDLWKLKFPNTSIIHLTALCSDHRPLLFKLHASRDNLPRPFKFESMWLAHLDTIFVVEEAWNRQKFFVARIRNTKAALKQ